MKFEIEQEFVKALIDYLAAKPFAEVYQAVITLNSLKPLKEEVEAVAKTK